MSAKRVDPNNAVASTATHEGEGRFTRRMLKRKTSSFNEKRPSGLVRHVHLAARLLGVGSVSPCKRLPARRTLLAWGV